MMLLHEVIPNDTSYSYFFTVAVAADDVRGARQIRGGIPLKAAG